MDQLRHGVKRRPHMNIKTLSKFVAVATISMLLAMALVIFNALQTERRVVRSEDHRLRSLELAHELFQSSEDLSRMARSYVTTADPLYEERYRGQPISNAVEIFVSPAGATIRVQALPKPSI